MRFLPALCLSALAATAAPPLSPLSIDYPASGAVFPPEFTPPTLLWRDPSPARSWRVEFHFSDGRPPLAALSSGEPMQLGPLDPRAVSETNRPPQLTPTQAATHSFRPDPALWAHFKRRSSTRPASLRITGLAPSGAPLSSASILISTSPDPVGAPIFYRDVPLMPAETEKGVIKPLASHAVRLIEWRLRDIAQTESRVVLAGMPTCGNCHSFSLDGKTLGMDLDGPQNHKGLYALAEVKPEMTIGDANVLEWATARGRLEGRMRVGFMSQLSPDGRFVVTTVSAAALAASSPQLPSNYFVANFTDYRFLQVFYPTQGILAWYSRSTGALQPLPGADDPRFVQASAVWSPDGKFLVFARAAARDPNPPNAPPALRANDPNEVQIRYDLYRIPFNDGRGGLATPIAGASANGMSNSFPKLSPDGRWIVFVQARNGQLMRPDGQLYIVPAAGGAARRMNCNTPLMNSWHSFSPNGRWMVFSSKARSPYTQMYLTHIDENGNDSPPILVENSTASNRAVNIPEFVNIPPDGLRRIDVPAVESYRLFDTALELQQKGALAPAIDSYRRVLAANPRHADAHNHLGMVLFQSGRPGEAATHFRAALALRPTYLQARCGLGSVLATQGSLDAAINEFRAALATDETYAPAHSNLALALIQKGLAAQALAHFTRALELRPSDVPARTNYGSALASLGHTAEALAQLRRAIDLDPAHAPAHFNLGLLLAARSETSDAVHAWQQAIRLQPDHLEALNQAAWALSVSPDPTVRDGALAVTLARRAVALSSSNDPRLLDTLAAALAESGRFDQAVAAAQSALRLAPPAQSAPLAARLALYRAHKPYRQPAPVLKPPTP